MFKRPISWAVIITFAFSLVGPYKPAQSAEPVLGLPAPGTMVNLSPAYQPVIIRGLTVHKNNPFLFDFIVDVGQDKMAGDSLKKEGEKLIKYFLASLAIPDKDVWVNLSPYEKDRMIPQALGQTDMGRDLLEQDYILKQITASLIYPEKQLGKKFWDTVYSKAQTMYGTTQIPVNTFNKVWIMADRAEVFEHNQTAFVVDSHLKVMLEEDYLALTKHQGNNATHSITSNIVRQIVLPELEKEVNTGKNFANLRQIFNSIILSSWYKKNLQQALLNQLYADKSKVKGINLDDPSIKQQIYEQYLKAYKKGVFNYIKEDVNTANGQTSPRKYFSGGINEGMADHPSKTIDPATLSGLKDKNLVDFAMLTAVAQKPAAKPSKATIPVSISFTSLPVMFDPSLYNKEFALITSRRGSKSYRSKGQRSSIVGENYLLERRTAQDNLRRVLKVPNNFQIFLLRSQAEDSYELVTKNLLKPEGIGAYINSGYFSMKAIEAAKKIAGKAIKEIGSPNSFLPTKIDFKMLPKNTNYVHMTWNDSVFGTEWKDLPDTGIPLVVDARSNLLSRSITRQDWNKIGVIYGAISKDIGRSGFSAMIIRNDLIGNSMPGTPKAEQYLAWKNDPSLKIVSPELLDMQTLNLMLDKYGDVEILDEEAQERSQMIYFLIEISKGFYEGIANRDDRSRINVTFRLKNPDLTNKFLEEAAQQGLNNLAGFPEKNGGPQGVTLRIGMSNGMPMANVKKLAEFMENFEEKYSDKAMLSPRKNYSFSAGPGMIAQSVWDAKKRLIGDHDGTGLDWNERTFVRPEYTNLQNTTIEKLRELLGVPKNFKIFLSPFPVTIAFNFAVRNLLPINKKALYINSGVFSTRAFQAAQEIAEGTKGYEKGDIIEIASSKNQEYSVLPEINPKMFQQPASYVYMTWNNTVYGTEWKSLPDTHGIPLIIDATSNILSAKITPEDWQKIGGIYAGVQKNIGLSGFSIAIVRDDLISENTMPGTSEAEKYITWINKPTYTTPPVDDVLMLSLVLDEFKERGGIDVLVKQAEEKQKLLYDVIDSSNGFYQGLVVKHEDRSRMNVTLRLKNPDLTDVFHAETEAQGLWDIKGFAEANGGPKGKTLRISIYNGMPIEGVQKLAAFMKEFQKKYRDAAMTTVEAAAPEFSTILKPIPKKMPALVMERDRYGNENNR